MSNVTFLIDQSSERKILLSSLFHLRQLPQVRIVGKYNDLPIEDLLQLTRDLNAAVRETVKVNEDVMSAYEATLATVRLAEKSVRIRKEKKKQVESKDSSKRNLGYSGRRIFCQKPLKTFKIGELKEVREAVKKDPTALPSLNYLFRYEDETDTQEQLRYIQEGAEELLTEWQQESEAVLRSRRKNPKDPLYRSDKTTHIYTQSESAGSTSGNPGASESVPKQKIPIFPPTPEPTEESDNLAHLLSIPRDQTQTLIEGASPFLDLSAFINDDEITPVNITQLAPYMQLPNLSRSWLESVEVSPLEAHIIQENSADPNFNEVVRSTIFSSTRDEAELFSDSSEEEI